MNVHSIQTPYWDWVRSEAALIDSDGCTGVSGLFKEPCWEHDMSFSHAKDPRDAYRLWRQGVIEYWAAAQPITFEEANRRFKQGHQQRTKLGNFWWINPMVWWRWRGVARLARGAWDRHRARERTGERT